MKFTFPALKKSQPKNFEARSRKTTAIAIVTQRPHIIPPITLRKSLAPRTSPYKVDPQFGHRIQKQRNGMISKLSPRIGVRPMSAGNAADPPGNAIVSWYGLAGGAKRSPAS